MNTFEIGEVVKWMAGNNTCIGLVYDDTGGDTVNVLLVEVNGRKAKSHLQVVRNLLNRYELQKADSL